MTSVTSVTQFGTGLIVSAPPQAWPLWSWKIAEV